jgi:hypothetical protein
VRALNKGPRKTRVVVPNVRKSAAERAREMSVVDWFQAFIKGTALVMILAPFGGALKINGTFPVIGITALVLVQQWQHQQRLAAIKKGRVTP